MTTKITKIEVINETIQSYKATVITLNSIPSVEDQNTLFGNDESIVLEF